MAADFPWNAPRRHRVLPRPRADARYVAEAHPTQDARSSVLPFRHRDAIHRWMFEAALPWWAEHGLDRQRGGYVEQMTMDGRDAGVAFKRTRVTARQIYVFSHGHILGFSRGAELARHGFHFLT